MLDVTLNAMTLYQLVLYLFWKLDQIYFSPRGNRVIQHWWWDSGKSHERTRGLRWAGGRSPRRARLEERLFSRASEPRNLLQHNWEICSSCIPNCSLADGRGFCLMKYVHLIKLGHWGFGASVQFLLLPLLLGERAVSRIVRNLDQKLEREQWWWRCLEIQS